MRALGLVAAVALIGGVALGAPGAAKRGAATKPKPKASEPLAKPAPEPVPKRAPDEPAPTAATGATDSPHDSFVDSMDCSGCHTPDGWKVSDLAGQAGGFDHARTGFPLLGAHTETACSGCHKGAGKVRTDCQGCHEDIHQRRLGGECAECHTATTWSDTDTLARHRRTRMPLTGKHALIECTACHQRQTERTYTDLPSDCFACHSKDYRRDIHPDHDGSATNPKIKALSRDCGRCHVTIAWTPAVAVPFGTALTIPAEHDARFPISWGAHRAIDCDSCHLSLKRPRLVTCTGCHAHDSSVLAREHRRRAIGGSASACLRCHPGGRAR